MRAPVISGARLPYPAPPLAFRIGVERALSWAWTMLWKAGASAIDPRRASEDEISELVQRKLNTLVRGRPCVSEFTGSLLETVVRGGVYKNYCGTSLNRAPDLVFRPIVMPRAVQNATDYGLFVECKVVDSTHPASRYVSNGLMRFVRGDYAWAMSVGLMVGYVRGDIPIEKALKGLSERKHHLKSPLFSRGDHDDGQPSASLSLHARPLVHPPTSQPLGDIEVAHLWLRSPVQ